MRTFIVKNDEKTVGLIFHDYASGEFGCRTKSSLFTRCFNLSTSRPICKFQWEDTKLRIMSVDSSEYRWVDEVVNSLNYWNISEYEEDVYGEVEFQELSDSLLELEVSIK